MILHPSSPEDLGQRLASAHARGEKVASVDLSALNRLLEHTPEDMTVTVQAGLTLSVLQASLAGSGQWLPIDPPAPEATTIGSILATDASGPRRYGYGTIRDHLIGLRVALADGRLVKNGGKVVKNVAGYDLCKLFVGDHGSLGVVVEATFRLRPLPEAERFVQAGCKSIEEAAALMGRVLESELTPMVLDLHNLSTPHPPFSTILGFAGTRDEVDWQLARAGQLGVSEPSDLGYEKGFWSDTAAAPRHRLSVLSSRLPQAIGDLGGARFVARAGNGVVFYRGGPKPPQTELPLSLMRRIKDAFDPKRILPELPL